MFILKRDDFYDELKREFGQLIHKSVACLADAYTSSAFFSICYLLGITFHPLSKASLKFSVEAVVESKIRYIIADSDAVLITAQLDRLELKYSSSLLSCDLVTFTLLMIDSFEAIGMYSISTSTITS